MRTATRWITGSLVALALVAIAGKAAAANLLTNPGFEDGVLSPWVGYGLSGSSTISVTTPDNGPSWGGTHAAYLDNQAQALGLTMAQVTPPGTAMPGVVHYSFDLKVGNAANGGVFFVEIFAQNPGGAVIGSAGLLGNYSPANWTTYSGSFVAPANTDHLTIQFEAVTGAVAGSVSSMHVDNVDLHQDVVTPTVQSTWGRIKSLYR